MPTTEQIEAMRGVVAKLQPAAVEALNLLFWEAVSERVESLPDDARTQAQDHLYALWALIDDTEEETGGEEPSAT